MSQSPVPAQNRNHLLELTRDEVATRLADRPVALLPLGATEQHGHHLPLGTDVYLAEALADRIAARVDGIVLPTVPFGYSWVWQDVPGTITVGTSTLAAYLHDVVDSVERSGFGMLVLVDGHESNTSVMKHVARECAGRADLPVVRLFYPRMDEIRSTECESGTWFGMIHACEFETSLLLEARPDLVDMDRAVREYPPFSPEYTYGAEQLGNLSVSGVFGDATSATAEKGARMMEAFAAESARIIRRFAGRQG